MPEKRAPLFNSKSKTVWAAIASILWGVAQTYDPAELADLIQMIADGDSGVLAILLGLVGIFMRQPVEDIRRDLQELRKGRGL